MMQAIESAMNEKGFTAERTKEAQGLHTIALYDYAQVGGFVDKLVGCFDEGQSDAQLITAVNAAFGTELKSEDYSKIMNSIRAKAINVSKFVDPKTKNNVDLAEWAKQAYAKKWGYVYGTYSEVLNESILRLTVQLEQYAAMRRKQESAKSRLDEIYTILDGLQNHPMEYDDKLVRQIIECVVVESKEKIKVVFIGGTEIEMALQRD